VALLHAIAEASAAGGAHIVDDSEVETPGVCHLETWVTRFVPGDGYLNLAPACTTEQIPFLEIGASFQHYWDQVINAELFGPAMKVKFQSGTTGLGAGLALNAGVDMRTGNLGMAQLLMLVTLPIDEKVKVNLNAGWSYLKADQPNALFWGDRPKPRWAGTSASWSRSSDARPRGWSAPRWAFAIRRPSRAAKAGSTSISWPEATSTPSVRAFSRSA